MAGLASTKALVARIRYHIEKAKFCGLENHEATQLLMEAADALETMPIADPDRAVHAAVFDKEEIYDGCTVQVLTNTVTGDVSVGWWKNEEGEK